MLVERFRRARLDSVRRILCLGAHSDDIEIGAGGTLLKLAGRVSDLEIWWVVFSAAGLRAEEARRSADEFLSGVTNQQVRIGSFRESYFPSEWPSIKDWFEHIKANFDPEVRTRKETAVILMKLLGAPTLCD